MVMGRQDLWEGEGRPTELRWPRLLVLCPSLSGSKIQGIRIPNVLCVVTVDCYVLLLLLHIVITHHWMSGSVGSPSTDFFEPSEHLSATVYFSTGWTKAIVTGATPEISRGYAWLEDTITGVSERSCLSKPFLVPSWFMSISLGSRNATTPVLTPLQIPESPWNLCMP